MNVYGKKPKCNTASCIDIPPKMGPAMQKMNYNKKGMPMSGVKFGEENVYKGLSNDLTPQRKRR